MYWELWDTESRSRVAEFDSEEEGLQAVREILGAHPPHVLDTLALVAMYDEGDSHETELPPALTGDALRARLAASAHSFTSQSPRRTMKVRIEDKEALAGLSWEALKAYVERTGWKRIDDMPGKAVVYQHPDKQGRLREVVVPIRRDFADYAARMGDAVGALARVEDRSELDVYDDLSTSRAETTRKVHARIRKWLAEEGWQIEDVPDPDASLNIIVTLRDGKHVSVLQARDRSDQIVVALSVSFGDTIQSLMAQNVAGMQQEILWSIQHDILVMGLEFAIIGINPIRVCYASSIYFDGLTKDALIHRIRLALRALALSERVIARGLREAGLSPEIAAEIARTANVVPFLKRMADEDFSNSVMAAS